MQKRRNSDSAKIITELINKGGSITAKEISLTIGVTQKTLISWQREKVPSAAHRTALREYLKRVRIQRLKDVRQVNSPLGELFPDPDEMEIIDKEDKKQKAIQKAIDNMDSPW